MATQSLELGGRPLYEIIYEVLRQHLVDGSLASGLVLGEASVARAFRSSRIPAAAALQRLSDEGLIKKFDGRGYVAACRRIAEDIAEAERVAAGEYHAPQGELIISVPFVIGRTFVTPVVVEFLEAHPDIRIDVQQTDRVVNLVQEHVDLALRVGALPDSSLIATRRFCPPYHLPLRLGRMTVC